MSFRNDLPMKERLVAALYRYAGNQAQCFDRMRREGVEITPRAISYWYSLSHPHYPRGEYVVALCQIFGTAFRDMVIPDVPESKPKTATVTNIQDWRKKA